MNQTAAVVFALRGFVNFRNEEVSLSQTKHAMGRRELNRGKYNGTTKIMISDVSWNENT